MTTSTLTAYQLTTTTPDCEDAIRGAYSAGNDGGDGYAVGADDDWDDVCSHDDEIGLPLHRYLDGDLAVYWAEGEDSAVLVAGGWAVRVEIDD